MDAYHGYAGNVLYIDLNDQKIGQEPLDQKLIDDFTGGSGFGNKLIYDLLPPGTDPLSPDNPIIISTGALGGSLVPASSKFSVTTRFSIKTIGSGYAGGSLSSMLKWAGYDCVVITGKAGKPVYLEITDEGVTICDAKDLWGKDIARTTSELWKKYGDCGVLAIGPAAEKLISLSFAKVDNLSTIGRGGLGSVLGAKKLKAVVTRGKRRITAADPKRFLKAVAEARKALLGLPYANDWVKYGIMMAWDMWKEIGFVSHNFSKLYSKEKAWKLFGKRSFDKVRKKSLACTSCPLGDKFLFQITEGEHAGFEEPTTHPMGHVMLWGIRAGAQSNEEALVAHNYCDKQGLDEYVVTGVIDFAIDLYEKGVITKEDTGGMELKQDFSTFMALTQQIVKQEGFGVILGSGYEAMIERFGEESKKYAIHIKGLDVGHDPRGGSINMFLEQCVDPRGVTAIPANSPANAPGRKPASIERYLATLGAPHDARERVCNGPKGINIARLNRWVEDFYSVNNALGICTRQPIYQCYVGDLLAELYSSLTGVEKSKEQLLFNGARAWNVFKAANVRDGFTRKDDKWPEKFFEVMFTEEGKEFRMRDYYGKDLAKEDVEELFDDYYSERGWDIEKGVPTRKNLEEIGLKYIADDLKKSGIL